jgi:phenylalanyl-tRNA synthetase beta chain
MALSVTLRPFERTLTDADIQAICDAIVAQVAKVTGGELRG